MKRILIILLTVMFLFSGCFNKPAPDSNFSPSGNIVNGSEQVTVTNPNTNPVITTELLEEIAQGKVPGASIIHKFGASTLDTTIHPVTQSQTYFSGTTIQPLEFVSDNPLDTHNGSGAQVITIIGLNTTYEEVIFNITTNGTTPVQLPINLTRLYRWYVERSGSYASPTTPSHYGELTIRGTGGGTVWSVIVNSPVPIGQSQIGVYTIPKGKTGWLLSKNVFTDTTKTADIYLFHRCHADDVTPPYSGVRRLIEREVGVQGGFSITFEGGKGPFVGPCDIGFLGGVSVGTADASVEFELVVLDS